MLTVNLGKVPTYKTAKLRTRAKRFGYERTAVVTASMKLHAHEAPFKRV